MNFPKFMMRQTGGFAVGAISTRSSPASRASWRASDITTMPSASPSAPISRTSFQRICSLTRMFVLSIFHLRNRFGLPARDRRRGGREKIGHGHGAGVASVAQAHGDRSGGGLLLAHHQHRRDFLELTPADPGAELLVLVVELDAQPAGAQGRRDLLRRLGETVRDREHDGLHGRDPEREVPTRVLDQDPDETLEGAQDRAVHDDRPVLAAVLADVLQVEALRVLEVDLDRAELPGTADRVLDAKVDLGAIERAVAGRDDMRAVRLLERGSESLLSLIP